MPPRRVWVYADGRQAEARVVAWYGPIPSMKTWFKAEEDIHTNVTKLMARYIQENAIKMSGGLFTSKPWNEYNRDDYEREVIGKRTVHANNYGMGNEQFSFVTKVPRAYAAMIQDIYFSLFPEVITGYQARIAEELLLKKMITNAHGWPRIFYGRVNEAMKRAAYAWYASSTIGGWLVLIWTALSEEGWDVPLQNHDGLGIATTEDRIDEAATRIVELVNTPLIIHGESLTIPVDIKVGPTWGRLTKWAGKSEIG